MPPYIYYGSTFDSGKLNFEDVLYAYSKSFFPMGGEDGIIDWVTHEPRALIPLDGKSGLKISRSLKQVLAKKMFEIRVDTCFRDVIDMCSVVHESTWITPVIKRLYNELHEKGYAHSVEAFKGGKLCGGLYGVAYKGAFFGESMFHTESNASKAALVSLHEILKKNKFILFDIQMMTPIFLSLGAVEIQNNEYETLLKRAMRVSRQFNYKESE